jgi:hypothetical protein
MMALMYLLGKIAAKLWLVELILAWQNPRITRNTNELAQK